MDINDTTSINASTSDSVILSINGLGSTSQYARMKNKNWSDCRYTKKNNLINRLRMGNDRDSAFSSRIKYRNVDQQMRVIRDDNQHPRTPRTTVKMGEVKTCPALPLGYLLISKLSDLVFHLIWIDHPKYFTVHFLKIRSQGRFQCWNWLPPVVPSRDTT